MPRGRIVEGCDVEHWRYTGTHLQSLNRTVEKPPEFAISS